MAFTVHTKNETVGYAAFDSFTEAVVFHLNNADSTTMFENGHRIPVGDINRSAAYLLKIGALAQVVSPESGEYKYYETAKK